MWTEQEKAFLEALTELSKKHKIIIEGCGCCGSPTLQALESEGEYDHEQDAMSDFEWIKKVK